MTMLVKLYQEEIFNSPEDEDEDEDEDKNEDGEDESYFTDRVTNYVKENVKDCVKVAFEEAVKLVEKKETVGYFLKNFELAPGLRPVV